MEVELRWKRRRIGNCLLTLALSVSALPVKYTSLTWPLMRHRLISFCDYCPEFSPLFLPLSSPLWVCSSFRMCEMPKEPYGSPGAYLHTSSILTQDGFSHHWKHRLPSYSSPGWLPSFLVWGFTILVWSRMKTPKLRNPSATSDKWLPGRRRFLTCLEDKQ